MDRSQALQRPPKLKNPDPELERWLYQIWMLLSSGVGQKQLNIINELEDRMSAVMSGNSSISTSSADNRIDTMSSYMEGGSNGDTFTESTFPAHMLTSRTDGTHADSDGLTLYWIGAI